MNKSSNGFKLTTVILAVFVLGVSAMISNASIMTDVDVVSESS